MTLEKICAMKTLSCQPVFLFLNSGDSKLDRIQKPISVCTVSIRTALLIITIIISESLPKEQTRT